MDGYYSDTYLDWEPDWRQDWDWDLPENRPLLPPGKADLIPVEILSEVFLITLYGWSQYRTKLSLVCQRWRAIILSTPGIHSQLTIRRATQKETVQEFIQGRKSRLDVTINMNDERDGGDFNAESFLACFMAAAQAASRWSSFNLISPPPYGEYTGLQILQPLVHLKSFKVAGGFDGFVEPLMTALSRSASPNLTIIQFENPAAVLYLVRPACLHISHSLRTLNIQLPKKTDSPVDILPHLHRLEVFKARHLCLPFYPPDAPLPLTDTLHSLDMKSVSVQWMAGHAFLTLKACNIIFPHHGDIIQALQPVTMPSCSYFRYHSNNLHPLTRFHLPSLRTLDVKSGQWNVWRGNPQLAALCPLVAGGAKSLTSLTLDIECSEKLLVYMLSLVPALQKLLLRLARPNGLSTTFFQAFIVREPNDDSASDMVGSPSQAITPLCPSLHSLRLHYRRWLGGPDNKALIVALGGIVASRVKSILDLKLSFDGPVYSRFGARWSIHEPVWKPQNLEGPDLILGISTPHGTIPVSVSLSPYKPIPLPFKEADYLRLCRSCSLEFRFAHDHMELVMADDYDRPPRATSLPCALPLFSALRVLVVERANPSFLAGHTFHKLERCRVVKLPNSFSTSLLFTETEMPVCTRIDVDNSYLLATFKLPQIHELAIDCSDPKFSMIWENHIAVNANLSGLTLLHMNKWPFDGDLITILRSLPSLETLIISSRLRLGIASFKAFLPMGAYDTFGLKETSGEGQRSRLLCPRLQCLQIEGKNLLEPELKPILKKIVTVRAECGSPLKDFTFSTVWPSLRSNLIGRNGRFTMRNIDLPEKTVGFKLDI